MTNIDYINKTLIEEILSEIQISDAKYEEAEKRYGAISDWLNRTGSSVAEFSPKIYPQGSFLLGTAIKPTTLKDEYDVDIVCELNISKHFISQSALKKMIGKEVKAYAKAKGMDYEPSEGKRCWTLVYADGTHFHIDILPAVPDTRLLLEFKNDTRVRPDWLETAIAITDKTHIEYESITNGWPVSNPKGHLNWFKESMKVQYEAQVKAIHEAYRGEIEDLPSYKVLTPLQQVIQLLKYHRNVMFENDLENKPISIIITTLAAKSYGNEADLMVALVNIASGMRRAISQNTKGEWVVTNPVNPNENFADKWVLNPLLAENFFKWLNQVEEDFSDYTLTNKIENLSESYKKSFGYGVVANAIRKTASRKNPISKSARIVDIKPNRPWRNCL